MGESERNNLDLNANSSPLFHFMQRQLLLHPRVQVYFPKPKKLYLTLSYSGLFSTNDNEAISSLNKNIYCPCHSTLATYYPVREWLIPVIIIVSIGCHYIWWRHSDSHISKWRINWLMNKHSTLYLLWPSTDVIFNTIIFSYIFPLTETTYYHVTDLVIIFACTHLIQRRYIREYVYSQLATKTTGILS